MTNEIRDIDKAVAYEIITAMGEDGLSALLTVATETPHLADISFIETTQRPPPVFFLPLQISLGAQR